VVTLDLDHAVPDRPAATAALFELLGQLFQRGLGEGQAGDHRDSLAGSTRGFTADAHHGLGAAGLRGDDRAGHRAAFCIDVHAAKFRASVPRLEWVMHRTIARLLCLLILCLPNGAIAADPRLERELRELLEWLPGRYAGEVPDPANAASGKRITLYHKIVRIEAPQFGETVFYHQISRDGFDADRPAQQKIYAFDRNPERTENRMRSWVFYPNQGGANLEKDPAAIAALQAAALMNFPLECAIKWRRGARPLSFVAKVKREECSYRSAAFRQNIRPEMTYELTRTTFGIEDILYGESGAPLFPSAGVLTVARVPLPASPAAPVGSMAAVLAASKADEWRALDPARTLYMELDAGRVIIELAPRFAKAHFANLQALVANRWFDGLSINRVQDGFVTQWGDASERKPMPYAERKLAPEFERAWTKDVPFDALRDGDVYAPQVGFVDGFAAAGDRKQGRIWLAHCYGVIGVGRDAAEDSGNAAELYAVIGHAPRHLDRNLTVIGRVVQGMELLAALPRGTKALGFYETAAERLPIRSVRYASEVPEEERTPLEALRTDTPSFAAVTEARRNRRDDFYQRPAGRIDLCNVPLPIRVAR
jgi:peptidylprolyl isomerase